MLRVAASAPESEPGGFEPPMIAIEVSRRAAERLWREIGLLLAHETISAAGHPRACYRLPEH